MKKQLISLALIGWMVLTGCQPKTSSQGSEGSISSNASSASVTPLSSLDEGDIKRDTNGNIIYSGINLNMWAVTTGDDATTQDSIISRFNQEYDGMIKVTTKHISRYELETQLQSTMEFDKENAPDLLFSHGSRANEYVARKWLLPIEPYLEKAGLSIDKSDYVTSLLDATTVDGHVYGLPQDVHSAMVEVRTDILTKNNLSIPTDYQELCDVCEQATSLAAAGNLWIRGTNSSGYETTEWRKADTVSPYYPFPISYGDMWVHEFFGYTAAIQNGGSIVASDGKPGWNTPETVNGIQTVRDWVMPDSNATNKHALSTNYGADYDVGYTPFISGNAIFKLNGPWVYQSELTEFDRSFKADGGSKNITTMTMSGLLAKDASKDYAKKIKGEGHAFMLLNSVTSMTKACAAMVFSDWMVNNAGIEWAKRGHLPSLKSVQASSDYTSDAAYDAYVKNWGSCDDYVVVPPTPYYTYVDTYFKNALQLSMDANSKDKTVASIVQAQYDDCIDYIDLNS
jgi:ABC-type glycerol-3-phosphate transport system substrate-binding protein